MKIVVYAICKNEAAFVDRWMDSMSEADEVVVLDTGSSDDSVTKLRARGAYVVCKEIAPWRFDAARNASLSLVSADADFCVCTDLDEVFRPGWRTALEQACQEGVGQIKYRYTWSFDRNGNESVVFYGEKIHARYGYRWVHPVHEVLQWCGEGTPGKTVVAAGVQLDHHADHTKSRGQYLPLLELSVREDPNDDRNVHYLGREYMYKGQYDSAIRMLQRHLSMPSATWKDERSASMRYIARCLCGKKEYVSARDWYLRAIAEAPYLREAYVDLALMLYENKEWDGVLYFTRCALNISIRPLTYISESAAWGSLPHDLRSIAFYHIGNLEEALSEAHKALEANPNDARLAGNAALLQRRLSEKIMQS